MEKDKIISLIFSIIDKTNELLLEEQRLEKTLDAKLYGIDGKLDSLGMVNFIVALEQKVYEEMGRSFVLINEDTMSQEKSPFQTVSSLTEFLNQLFNESENE